jgi:diguanylate cyclase (GGDEF)-like protein
MVYRGSGVLVFLAGCALSFRLFAGVSPEVTGGTAEVLLKQADGIKTSNQGEFTALLRRLGDGSLELSQEQRLYLEYLEAWQVAYRGDYKTAITLLDRVMAQSGDPTLRVRAGFTAVNILGIASRYEEAFAQLDPLVDQLPQVADKETRLTGLSVAAQFYSEAGQYDLATDYANKLLSENPVGQGACRGRYFKLEALFKSGQLRSVGEQFRDGIEVCAKAAEPIFGNLIRSYAAKAELDQGKPDNAIKLLRQGYAEVKETHYPPLIALFDASFAQAFWKVGDQTSARRFAQSAIDSGIKNEYTEPLVTAYRLLYELDKQRGDLASALAWHEKYMAANKGYLNTVSAKALAYQTVAQQVLTTKMQVDTLAEQNKILQLQQSLGKKAMEASRLWIILLLLLLGFIGFVAYRIKRSQLKFMKLARRDGLTGIFNRQHFVSEAERLLQYCCKSNRDACLVLLDLDHFKLVNDTHGHAVGDRVLKRAVAACQAHLRSTDLFGRLGGEEFGMLLPECSPDQVLARVEQMRLAIAAVSTGEIGAVVTVSASFGVASAAASGYELRQLMTDADDALYEAKREGRNRINLSASRGAQLSLV